MIKKAEEARDQSKVKNMADGMMAFENSWHLSENFERNCIEKCHMSIEQQLEFSLDMKSDSENDNPPCHACHNKKEGLKGSKLFQPPQQQPSDNTQTITEQNETISLHDLKS